MEDRTCENCHNFICKDMYPTMQKEYISLCLNSNRKLFVSSNEKERADNERRRNE